MRNTLPAVGQTATAIQGAAANSPELRHEAFMAAKLAEFIAAGGKIKYRPDRWPTLPRPWEVRDFPDDLPEESTAWVDRERNTRERERVASQRELAGWDQR